MGSFYRLLIICENEKKIEIDELLDLSESNVEVGWELIVEENSILFNQALTYFAELISNNLSSLKNIGITTEMISFWYMYEYEQQCNIEFNSELMKNLGNLGVTLCISCWEK
jgi:hypothetical protein